MRPTHTHSGRESGHQSFVPVLCVYVFRVQRHHVLADLISKLALVLPAARSCGVQCSLNAVVVDHPESSVATADFFVYALVSPLWSKFYVSATGIERPRAPLERWI